MKLSNAGIGTMRINQLDEMYPVQDMLMQSGQLVQYGAGIMAYGHIPFLVKRKVERVIEEVLNEYGCIEVSLPTLQPDSIWKNSGRWDHYVEEGTMLTVESNKGTFCLAPTGEEAVVEFAKEKLKSYKHLPATFYQIGEKYRNEIRTRGYLLRGKSFTMMDAYSFNEGEEDLIESYQKVRDAYLEIFKRLGLPVVPVVADNGAMGGKKSEEFMMISPIGEDTILYDEETGIGLNTEILEKEDYKEYLRKEYGITDISRLQEKRTIELGHIFQLGTRYSEMMGANYITKEGKTQNYYMGCYGIGVSRTVATIYENSAIQDENGKVVGISLPKEIAPYQVQIIPKVENEEKVKQANALYETLTKQGIVAILDDRNNSSMGAKMKDCKVLGTPFMVVLGDKVEEGFVEFENTKTGEKEVISEEELIERIK
ncbi:MAG: hypothetical protein HFJ26_06400 [Clostridia bacterium]|nr:hypothetical protein [Clostridia bacterium]